ncbi:TetR family transcriptional regulator [Sulfuritortus calidifontis]|uniref:TetR family transcriptional regulator n=1 Tax=Sulfuritortus calidifontis TaxID=1914471 RepID=A0A4R3JWV5_9PROT|nr:TetR/AcrR family transcriptional regulator [Sulfuritortus calidifontis]TCS71543.1 TetR family transcriptional regulator [Sulfuritortus calidifontis]
MSARLPTEHRQAEMVQAMLTLTEQQGVETITTSDIAKSVGLSQGAVFRHFPNKQSIWLAAIDWVQRTLLAAIDGAAQTKALPLERLQAMFEAHVDFVARHPGVPRLLFHELQRPGDSPVKKSVRALLAAYRRRLIGLLNEAKQAGQARAGLDTDAAATLFIGMIQGLVMQTMLMGKTQAMRPIASGLFAIYLDGIRRPA